MRWRRDVRRDLGKWFTIFALVPHLCEVCDSRFWLESGRRKRIFQCEAGSLWTHHCDRESCWHPERARGVPESGV